MIVLMCGIDFSTCNNCDFVHSILAKGSCIIVVSTSLFVSSDKSAEYHGSLEPMKTSVVTCCKLPLWDGNRMASLALCGSLSHCYFLLDVGTSGLCSTFYRPDTEFFRLLFHYSINKFLFIIYFIKC